MKIAVYHNLVSGGNKRSLHDTIRGMKAQGHRVEVYNLSTSEEMLFSLRAVADKVITRPLWNPRLRGPLQSLTPFVRLLQLVPLWQTNRAIARTINSEAYDLVWVANCSITQHPIVLSYLKKPYILYTAEHYRGHYDRMMWKLRAAARNSHTLAHTAYDAYFRLFTWIVSYVDAWSIQSVARILVNSQHTQENVMRFYGKKSAVLYLGVDTATFVPLSGTKENMILSVGALNPMKGHEYVIRSLQYLPPHQRPRLVIVADRAEARSERLRLEMLADTLHVDLRILMGVSDIELVDLYNRAKLVVCASFLEPFGLVPLEAMACATPVVAVREGGYRESVLHEETGLLVPRDEQAIGEAIGQILSDDALRERLGARGVDFVKRHFSLDTYWANLAQHLAALPPVSA